MTETVTPAESSPAPSGNDDATLHPSDILLNLIVGFLAPMFLSAGGGDIRFARLAALETVNGYRARNHADLLSIAQIIGFGLAALGSLSLSMTDDLSVSMTLRLRGNANACNRAAEQHRRTLRVGCATFQGNAEGMAQSWEKLRGAADAVGMAAAQEQAETVEARMEVVPPTEPDSASAMMLAAAPTPAPKPDMLLVQEQKRQAMWGAAAADVAAEITAGLPKLPITERKVAAMHVAALTSGADKLMSGAAPPRTGSSTLAGLMSHATI